jgi:exonuclease VII large subunit
LAFVAYLIHLVLLGNFALKDDRAQLKAAFFRNNNLYLKFRPEDGLEVLVRGVVGKVTMDQTMDQTMIDVGRIKGVRVGDEVVLIGKQGGDEIRAESLARTADLSM